MGIAVVKSSRSFLAVTAAAAVMPSVAVAQQTDPIFAVIRRHRAAFKEFVDASLAADEVKAEREGREVSQTIEDNLDAASIADAEAAELLASTAPITMAGLAAALAWLLEYEQGCVPNTLLQFLDTLVPSPLLAGG